MTISYVKYDPQTGRIIQQGQCGEDMYPPFKAFLALTPPTGEVIEAEAPGECYVDTATGTVKPCPPSPIVQDGPLFTNIPVGTTVRVNGNIMGVVDDGDVEFSHDEPGPHELVFEHPRYQRIAFEVTVP